MPEMSQTMQARLAELEGEFRQGEDRLRALVQQETALRETLLRISGAIEVLRELTSADGESAEPKEAGP
ncbi:hypothetical protein ACPC54_39895 [Kitasatospora sp. NPDC094028]